VVVQINIEASNPKIATLAFSVTFSNAASQLDFENFTGNFT
jgi:hypothetical protein